MGKQIKPSSNTTRRKVPRKKKVATKAAKASGPKAKVSHTAREVAKDKPPEFLGVDDPRNVSDPIEETDIFKRSELADLRKLVERGYGIPDELMVLVPTKLLKMIKTSAGKDLRAALKTLAAFERINTDKMNILAKLDLANKEGALGDKDDLDALRLSMQAELEVCGESDDE